MKVRNNKKNLKKLLMINIQMRIKTFKMNNLQSKKSEIIIKVKMIKKLI